MEVLLDVLHNLKITAVKLKPHGKGAVGGDMNSNGIRSIFNRHPSSSSAQNKKTLRFNAQTQEFVKHDSSLQAVSSGEMGKNGRFTRNKDRMTSFHNYMSVGDLFDLTIECL